MTVPSIESSAEVILQAVEADEVERDFLARALEFNAKVQLLAELIPSMDRVDRMMLAPYLDSADRVAALLTQMYGEQGENDHGKDSDF